MIKNLPNQIIFIRHGEKNEHHDDGNLNKTGEVHANCWTEFFKDKNRPANICMPNAFYAMKKENKKDSSDRPYQTILPLAKYNNLPINNNFLRDDYVNAVTDILYKNESKIVLVCWEHKVIVDLVNEIIKEVYNDKCDFKVHSWGNKILKSKDNPDDFSTLWKITFEENKLKLHVYSGCSVDSNKNYNFHNKENINPILFSV